MRFLWALLLLAAPSFAQDGPMTFISPYSPGGSDAFSRLIAEHFGQRLGAPAVLVNRDGGSGVVGMRVLSTSPPDGRTVAITPMTAIVVQPHMVRNLGLDPSQVAPVCGTNENHLGIVVRADSPIRSLADLLAAGRQRSLSYGSAGPNSLPFLGVWRISRATGVEFTHIAFRGDPPHLNETLAGRLDFSTAVVGGASEFILSGRMRLITVFSQSRHPDFPDVPTAREQGVDALQFSQVGIYAPRGTPEPVLDRLEALCREALQQDGVRRIAASLRSVIRYLPRAEFTAMIASEFEAYRGILRELGVQPE
ncbi:MAG: tripartite tricarboxylate transporter substrate binding protein [Rubritepida sp.]|nr:tripartite tricarboxylate transporter substrate binding protein [Rubritepida sp.]